jgi:hypothetical protein
MYAYKHINIHTYAYTYNTVYHALALGTPALTSALQFRHTQTFIGTYMYTYTYTHIIQCTTPCPLGHLRCPQGSTADGCVDCKNNNNTCLSYVSGTHFLFHMYVCIYTYIECVCVCIYIYIHIYMLLIDAWIARRISTPACCT